MHPCGELIHDKHVMSLTYKKEQKKTQKNVFKPKVTKQNLKEEDETTLG